MKQLKILVLAVSISGIVGTAYAAMVKVDNTDTIDYSAPNPSIKLGQPNNRSDFNNGGLNDNNSKQLGATGRGGKAKFPE